MILDEKLAKLLKDASRRAGGNIGDTRKSEFEVEDTCISQLPYGVKLS